MPFDGFPGVPFVARRPRIVHASTFDGTNDSLTRGADLTGAADGKVGTFFGAVRLDASGDGTNRPLFSNNVGANGIIQAEVLTTNKFSVSGFDATRTAVFRFDSANAYAGSATWLLVLASWDAANAVGHLYVGDVSDYALITAFVNADIDYTTGNFAVGTSPAAGTKFFGDMAEFYLDLTTYIDLSVTANRRKFITASGRPADLGPDGSRPTGSSPLVYLRHPFSQFGTNSGTGGNFTVNGALTLATTRP